MKNIRIKKLLIVKSIVILLGMAMLFSCKNDITAVSALAAGDSIPDLKAKNFEFLRSDSGRVVAKLESPVMIQYGGSDPHTIFPEGFRVEFYNRLMQVETVLQAEYGINYTQRKLLIARKNVVVNNYPKQEQLNSDELIWDQRRKRIYSEAKVKITTPTEVLYGKGMDSDEQFKRYEIFKARGEVEVEEEKK